MLIVIAIEIYRILIADGKHNGLLPAPRNHAIVNNHIGVAHRPLIDVSEDRRPGDNYIVVGVLCAGDTLLYEKGSDKFAVYFPEEGELDENLIYEDFYDFLTNLYDLL